MVYGVRHSLFADHGAQFAQIVPGMPRARQVGKYSLMSSHLKLVRPELTDYVRD